MHELELSVAWNRSVAADPVDGSRQAFDAVVNRHREPHRRYHTVAHVRWVIRHLISIAEVHTGVQLDRAVAAAFYHDAVYQPSSTDNEAASAALAARDLDSLGWPVEARHHVTSIIVASAGHGEHDDLTTAAFLTADLGVLAAAPHDYGEYARQVRAEYRHVDDEGWRRGRRQVLTRFLERPTLFDRRVAPPGWEQRARGNLTAELAALAER